MAHGSTGLAVTPVVGDANVHGSLLIVWIFEYDDPKIRVRGTYIIWIIFSRYIHTQYLRPVLKSLNIIKNNTFCQLKEINSRC